MKLQRSPPPTRNPPGRFLAGRAPRAGGFLQAALDYVASNDDEGHAWLQRKPYDPGPGNRAFFDEMYQVMNLLRAMDIEPAGRVLEVGSGPGWVTEMLALLGFRVDAVEPSADMIGLARERLARAREHYQIAEPLPVAFHATTLEELALPTGSFEAVLFHAALHHVEDEDRGLATCFELLVPGGVLGVSEAAWEPDNKSQADELEEEMRRFGTLENPFTRGYLDAALRRHGFTEIRRYHAINGWIPVEMGDLTVEEAADAKAIASNNLTARKPRPSGLTTATRAARHRARIEVLRCEREPLRVSFKVRLENHGESTWLARSDESGAVKLALRSQRFEREGQPRQQLPRELPPGGELVGDFAFELPRDFDHHDWYLDLVSEQAFWFSERGNRALRVEIPPRLTMASEIAVTAVTVEGNRVVIAAGLRNTGQAAWKQGPARVGCVNVALCTGTHGAASFAEGESRNLLPGVVLPGQRIELQLEYRMPADFRSRQWRLDLVSEGRFWFSQVGSAATAIELPGN